MSSTITETETRENRTRSPPDFSFPPKYTTTTRSPHTSSSSQKIPPNFGFPVHNPSPTSPSYKASSRTITNLPDPISDPVKPHLLTLPLEIRLQIYSHVLDTHPIHHAHLAPLPPPPSFAGLNTEQFWGYALHPSSLPGVSTPQMNASLEKITHILFPPSSPTLIEDSSETNYQTLEIAKEPPIKRGKVPTGLLLSCKQIYNETHTLPFQTSSFHFINWFWSGVYAARQFTRALKPWQSDAVRWVGIEVLARDLRVSGMKEIGGGIGAGEAGGAGKGEWEELCGLWKGVWGVKMCLKGAVISGAEKEMLEKRVGDEEEGGMSGRGEILNINSNWITSGLSQLHSLRLLELEIEDQDIPLSTKLSFCHELQYFLNNPTPSNPTSLETTKSKPEVHHQDRGQNRRENEVKVVFIQRSKPTPEEIEKHNPMAGNEEIHPYAYGEPGDESVWAEADRDM